MERVVSLSGGAGLQATSGHTIELTDELTASATIAVRGHELRWRRRARGGEVRARVKSREPNDRGIIFSRISSSSGLAPALAGVSSRHHATRQVDVGRGDDGIRARGERHGSNRARGPAGPEEAVSAREHHRE